MSVITNPISKRSCLVTVQPCAFSSHKWGRLQKKSGIQGHVTYNTIGVTGKIRTDFQGAQEDQTGVSGAVRKLLLTTLMTLETWTMRRETENSWRTWGIEMTTSEAVQMAGRVWHWEKRDRRRECAAGSNSMRVEFQPQWAGSFIGWSRATMHIAFNSSLILLL